MEARASSEAAEAPMTRAELARVRAELAQKIQDTLNRLSAASPIAATQDPDRPGGSCPEWASGRPDAHNLEEAKGAGIARILSID
jgi:hypothetical protein